MQRLRFLGVLLFQLYFFGVKAQNDQVVRKPEIVSEDSRKERSILLFTRKAADGRKGVVPISVNKVNLQSIWDNEPEQFSTILPLPDGKNQRVKFERSRFLTEDFKVITSDGRVLEGKEYAGLHYTLVSESGGSKIGGISFREQGLMAMISHELGNFNIGEEAPGSGKYVLVDDQALDRPSWDCGTPDTKDPLPNVDDLDLPENSSTTCRPVRIYMEADFQLYSRSSNNLATATSFVTGLFNVVRQVYANEQITLQLSSVFVWTSTDPFAAMTSLNTVLINFANSRPFGSYNGDLAHLLSARATSIGGMAYTGVLCNTVARYGFSSIFYQYSALPAYSWSVYCVAHELGHNFGSKHTHWCGWTLPGGGTGRIDSCYAGEGSCGTTTRARRGTIMSYCHVTSGGIDMNAGFGPLPGKAIRDGLLAATCIASNGCIATPTLTVDSVINRNNNYVLTLTIPSNHNASGWQVLEGNTVIQSGTLSSSTGLTRTFTISGKSNGTYTYSAVLTSSSSSSTSPTLSVSVDVPAPTTSFSSGDCTAPGLQAWYGSDGRMRFRYSLTSACNTYRVEVCRFASSDPNVVPAGTATPVACGVRNGMLSYTPTATERAQGFIERISDPQPANATTPGMGSFWYSVDVTCTGTGCTTTNRTRTFIFVPGI